MRPGAAAVIAATTALIAGCSSQPEAAPAADNVVAQTFVPNALDNRMSEIAAEGEAATNTSAVAKQSGDECLSPWSGSADNFVDKVKETLRDPDSFEHIETTIGNATSTGMRPITMKFRARNGFGGMDVTELPAALDPHDCTVTLLTSVKQVHRVLGR